MNGQRKVTSMNIGKGILLAVFISMGIVGCSKQNETIHLEMKKVDKSIMQVETNKALQLLRQYFGGELKAASVTRGPAGTLRINAENVTTGTKRSLYMLPDQQHLIDGVLYSPHMTKEQVTLQHGPVMQSRAVMNGQLAQSKEKMREKISKALSQTRNRNEIQHVTETAVKQRITESTKANRNHIDRLVETPTSVTPSTASLPRYNTVVDTEALFSRIENANWISSGTNKKILYVFFDFRCSACIEVHKYLEEHIKNNEAQIRYLPVGALGQESLNRASLSLIPKSNDARLRLMDLLAQPQPIDALLSVKPSLIESQRGTLAALSNFKLLLETKLIATPTFAYRTADGPQIRVLTSRDQISHVINIIVGT